MLGQQMAMGGINGPMHDMMDCGEMMVKPGGHEAMVERMQQMERRMDMMERQLRTMKQRLRQSR